MAEEHDSWLQSTLGIGADLLNQAKDTASGAAQAVQDTVAPAVQAVEQTVDNTVQAVQEAVAPAVQAVQQTVDNTVQTVKGAVAPAVQAVQQTVDNTVQMVQQAAAPAVQAVEDAFDGAKTKVEQAVDDLAGKAKDVAQIVEDATRRYAPVITLPNVGDIDVAAALSQAASQVVADSTPAKLPILTRADALVAEAGAILDSGMSPSATLDLPGPTVRFTGKCCTGPELNGFLNGIEGPRNALRLSINALNDAERGVTEACEQGKRICYGGLATCLVGSGVGPTVGTGACIAGAIACIAAASPVQNAIRVQAKAEEDLKVASGALERALGNYRFAYQFRCPDLLPVEPGSTPRQPKK